MSKSSYFPRFFAKRSIPGSSGTLGPCVRVTCPSSPCGYTLLWSLHLPSRIHRPPAATANTPHPLPLLLCMHPSSSLPLPPYPLTKHLDEYFLLLLFFHLISNQGRTLAATTLPPSPRAHAGHLRLPAARPLAACHRTDLVTHATRRPRHAQPPHPIAAPTNTITAIAPAITTSSKLIVSPNPPAPCTPLTGRHYSFTYQRAPATNAHKTSPTVLHRTNPKKVSISTFKLTTR